MTPVEESEKQPTLLEQMGGVSGLVFSSLPVVVFVLVNAFAGLMPAIWSALASAVAIGVVLFWNFAANRMWTYRGLSAHPK